MSSDVTAAYGHRAADYIAALGAMSSVHPADEHLVTSWASGIAGRVLDAGCGPGHWTAHLRKHGADVVGVDRVPEFIAHARAAHPDSAFRLGSIDALPETAGSVAGVLAWYSLIHHGPETIRRPLGEFARVLRPGGGMLVGFFVGPDVGAFDHAVTSAWWWPAEALAAQVDAAGFDVVETHTRTGAADGPRPHGAIVAVRRTDAPAVV
ncbi:class I SAM-dependent methyltransferase [Curtobacterium sp. 9128]|uniref:class I SAM-dependent methyltransferase n=1 Tax=Curtobacterium sp. 9128 TaxID=1793722 RepID=UPI0011A69FC2|nr:class I SAM-dependent methyltransferase [Curtobacterium sp. 9128]